MMAKWVLLIGGFLLLIITFLTLSNIVNDTGDSVNSDSSMDIQKALSFSQSVGFQQVINPRPVSYTHLTLPTNREV